jgi:hypothetical protein
LLGLAVAVWTIGDVGLTDIVQTARRMGLACFAGVCAWSPSPRGCWAAHGTPLPPASRCGPSCISPGRVWCAIPVSNLLPFSELGGIVIGVRRSIRAAVPPHRVYASFVVDPTTEMASQVVYTLFSLLAMAPLLAGAEAAELRPAIIGGTAGDDRLHLPVHEDAARGDLALRGGSWRASCPRRPCWPMSRPN